MTPREQALQATNIAGIRKALNCDPGSAISWAQKHNPGALPVRKPATHTPGVACPKPVGRNAKPAAKKGED